MSCRFKYLYCLVFVFFNFSLHAASSKTTAFEILQRMDYAQKHYEFESSFIYSQKGYPIELLRLQRSHQAGMVVERLKKLQGVPIEVVKKNKNIFLQVADAKPIKLGSQEIQKPLKTDWLHNLTSLLNYYEYKIVLNRIADRPALLLHLNPRDDYRYGYLLLQDQSTGLLLGYTLFDPTSKQILEQMLVMELNPGKLIENNKNEALSSAVAEVQQESVEHEKKSDWLVNWVPQGFSLVKHQVGKQLRNKRLVDYWLYSDGLSSLSIYVEDVKQKVGSVPIVYNGPTAVLTAEKGESRVSIIGEVPELTVLKVIDSVSKAKVNK